MSDSGDAWEGCFIFLAYFLGFLILCGIVTFIFGVVVYLVIIAAIIIAGVYVFKNWPAIVNKVKIQFAHAKSERSLEVKTIIEKVVAGSTDIMPDGEFQLYSQYIKRQINQKFRLSEIGEGNNVRLMQRKLEELVKSFNDSLIDQAVIDISGTIGEIDKAVGYRKQTYMRNISTMTKASYLDCKFINERWQKDVDSFKRPIWIVHKNLLSIIEKAESIAAKYSKEKVDSMFDDDVLHTESDYLNSLKAEFNAHVKNMSEVDELMDGLAGNK